MGLNEGVNVFLDEDGRPRDPIVYIPAYIRRYPFLLAKLRPDSDELSLCFDPTADAVGDFEEGEALFDGDKPSDGDQVDPRILRAVRSRRPAHRGVHGGAEEVATC